MTNAQWHHLAHDLTAAQVNTAYTSDQSVYSQVGVEKTTNENGEVSFTGLNLGVYLVKETEAPAGYIKAPDFLVFLPMTDATALNTWNYDVHAYPKNTFAMLDKAVTDKGKHAGDTIEYTLKADLPALATEDDSITKFQFVDDMDQTHLKEFAVSSFSLASADEETTTALASPEDYTVTTTNATTAATTNVNTDKLGVVTATLTEAGLAKATAARLATDDTLRTKAILVITAKVKAAGIAPNSAILNAGVNNSDTTTTSNEVHTYWGIIDILKYAEPTTTDGKNKETTLKTAESEYATAVTAYNTAKRASDADPDDTDLATATATALATLQAKKTALETAKSAMTRLANAEFELWLCNANGEIDATKASTNKLTVASANSWKTTSTGQLLISGIHVDDFANNASDSNTHFCLLETKAPTGYELYPKPIPFTLHRDDVIAADVDGTTTHIAQLVRVPESASTKVKLPLTGGQGIALLVVIGIGIIGVAVWNSRRRQHMQ